MIELTVNFSYCGSIFFTIIGTNRKDTVLYEQLIGLKTPWSVKKVDLFLEGQHVLA